MQIVDLYRADGKCQLTLTVLACLYRRLWAVLEMMECYMWPWEQLRRWVRLLHADCCTLHAWQAVAHQGLCLYRPQAWVMKTIPVHHAFYRQDSDTMAFCVLR